MYLKELDDIKRALSGKFSSAPDLFEFLHSIGYTKIGSGSFSVVYGNSSSVVIKVGTSGTKDAFVEFINYIKKHPRDINLPKIGTPRWCINNYNLNSSVHRAYSKNPQNTKKYFVVAMEKLTALPEAYHWVRVFQDVKINQPADRVKADVIDYFNSAQEFTPEQIDNFLNYPRINSLIISLVNLGNYYSVFDLHENNFMMRGDRIIITDPWY